MAEKGSENAIQTIW